MKKSCAATAVVLLAACQSITPQEPLRATAALQATKGSKAFGEATFEEVDGRVRVIVFTQGLAPGEHGFHIHEAGDCSSGDGMSAGGHFNPHGKPHGPPSNAERHAGDLPALNAGKDGRAKLDVAVDIMTLRPGAASIIGRSLIIHADPDDYKTQPTGNTGARIACGVIKPG
jgi:superoxide dismutase, Cu-Zn family